ncbi:putative redox protein, regulator of disulfide bond formation [Sphaerochaeta pleomorpha str. Grapes]|uniref:Putative redox protein, regulator of disulfide bond formation n=1 Tax=Sphaerochaeta pleomorpha (strain ATCC BAA-1885 / DSM 22778 / Grapes) TaxID=158190 RepID=G8QT45_SPHPG|nr:sulfurtransferase TusA family protein [Sphaerochaeta pleomorpha]AEV27950.1 putative redox protein, regulator of disulfide bond formation [Sphaerochaeta pleomorpha str. Grapes]
MLEIDARGLSCPQPVIETKKVLDRKIEKVTVLVDNQAAYENVTRYAKAAKYEVAAEKDGDSWSLVLTKA